MAQTKIEKIASIEDEIKQLRELQKQLTATQCTGAQGQNEAAMSAHGAF